MLSIKNDMEILVRQHYLDKIEKYLGKDTIIVLTGQRRVGKSYTLRMIRDVKAKDNNNNIIYIDKEKKAFDHIKTYQDLNTYIDAHYQTDKMNYILIDEIQEIEDFERTVRSYITEPDAEVIVTGSNAKMLSKELSTIIGGRYKEIYVQSLSYREFLQFHRLRDGDDALAKYIQFGGLPGLLKMGLDEDDAIEYQKDVLNTVLLKDVISRNNIRSVPFLEKLADFIADNIGKVISASSISKFMRSQGTNVSPDTIIDYARYLEDAYVIHRVSRYDIHGKRLFESNDKFYFEDHGLRNAQAGGTREGDIEKVIENIVYQHLISLGYRVNVGQLQAGEIDFVCTKKAGAQRIYVQVAYLIANDETREREFGNLHGIKDNYPKYVVSMTPGVTRSDDNGVIHLHLRHFLMLESLG